MGEPHTPIASPWRGEVGPRSGPGGGESRSEPFTPPRRSLSFAKADPLGSAFLTLRTAAKGRLRLPLQGRVSERVVRA